MAARKLYRSQTNKVLAGICGGIGEYLDADPTVIRLVWIVLTLLGGSGILLYVLGLFIIPKYPPATAAQNEKKSTGNSFSAIVGAVLVIIGIVFLLDNLNIFYVDEIFDWSWKFVLPAILILGGVYLLTRKDQTAPGRDEAMPGPAEAPAAVATPQRLLRRSITDKRIFGICGGLAQYFEVDSTIVRLLYAFFTVMSFGTGVIVYFVLYFVLPEETSHNLNPPHAV